MHCATKYLVMVFASLTPAVALAEEHRIWRAPDAEMGAVSWTGFTATPEISEVTLHLRGPGSAVLENLQGFRAGLALAYDYQTGKLVAGVAGEAFYTWMDGGGVGSAVGAYKSRLPVMGALRARLGYTEGRFLVYGAGGLALARMEVTDQARAMRAAKTLAGWVGGGGIEYAWNKHLTARIEYLHTGYGAARFSALPAAQDQVSSVTDPVRLQIAFRF